MEDNSAGDNITSKNKKKIPVRDPEKEVYEYPAVSSGDM